eukprot:339049_1
MSNPTPIHCNKRLTMYMAEDITLGDIVQITQKHLRGIVRFIGEINALRYTYDPVFGFNYFGIELCEALGDSNGSVNGEFYFETKENMALFVKRNQISHIVTINYNAPRLTIDDVIYMNQFRCNGRVRWIGKLQNDDHDTCTEYDPHLIHFGIELNKDRGTNDGHLNERICFSKCRSKHGVFVTHRDLSDLLIMRPSSLLLYGYLKEEYIPNDIQYAIKAFYNFIHINYHETVKISIKMESGTNKTVYYKKYDVYNMDKHIIGPCIYKPNDANHIYDTQSGIKIDTQTDDYLSVFDEMAMRYGATADELKQQMKLVGIIQSNGLRFV